MLRIFKIILNISDTRDKRLLGLFFTVSILATLVEVTLIYALSLVVGKLETVSINAIDEFQLVIVLALLLVSLIVQVLNIRLQAYTATSIGMRWSTRVLRTLYSAQYRLLATLKGADVLNFAVTETSRFTDYVVLPMLQLFSRFLLVTIVSAVLIFKFPVFSILFLLSFGTIYVLVFVFVRLRLNNHSSAVSGALEERNNIVLNSFLNLKLTLIKRNVRTEILDRFSEQGARIVASQSYTYTFVQFPRYVIEFTLLFLGAMLFYFGLIDVSFVTFAFAGFRILPHVQAIYAAFASLHSANSSFENVVSYFKTIGLDETFSTSEATNEKSGGVVVTDIKSLRVDNIDFSFDNQVIFSEFTFYADLSQKPLMIVGRTGSGKSTLIDLLSGLYPENFEKIFVNGVKYSDLDVQSFQDGLAYIPQMYFCAKARLGEYLSKNNSSLVDPKAVELFAELDLVFLVENDHILDFELEENFKNLSGGQRQRLMLALTILSAPKLLILDEATNALDKQTEKRVIEAIITRGIPMIMITHNPLLTEKFTVLNLSAE